MGCVDGRVAIVTGGGSGIGAATAEVLARAGASVVVADLDGGAAQAVADDIGSAALAVQVDVSDEEQVVEAVRRTLDTFGRIDALHNNAALVDPEHHARDGRVEDMAVEVWDRVLAVNLRGAMLCCKHVLPAMVRAGGGAVVNMSSGSARLGDLDRTAYGVSKAGIEALTRYVATQYGAAGVRANAVAPGLILTPASAANLPADRRDVLRENVLTSEFGRPEEVAQLVLYLLSDDSRYMTGQVLPFDGGQSAHQPTYAGFRALLP